MTQLITMSTLYTKLNQLGFSKSYVRKSGLPSWWNDELDEQSIAVLEGAGHIAKRFNLDLSSLLSEDKPVTFKSLPLQTKFKYHKQQETETPQTAHQIASRVAKVVSLGTTHDFSPISSDANYVREEVLKNSSKLNLQGLLELCWQHGIAVVYFSQYPDKSRKITGMVQWQKGLDEINRPVIVLSHKQTHPAWLAFHLAHELGHLALGHVNEGLLVDTKIENDDDDDDEESTASRFAVNLLLGNLDNCFRSQPIRSSRQLVRRIQTCLISHPEVDPCVLAFNYAWHTKNFGFSNNAVQELDSSNNGDKLINRYLEKHINWEQLDDDNSDHLDTILGE